MCKVCNTRLNVFEVDGKRTYTHAGEHLSSDPYNYDHAPVPVPEVEQDATAKTVCDFCGIPDPVWRNEARPAQDAFLEMHSADGTTRSIEYRDNNPDWLACDVCQSLINEDRRVALVGRSALRLVDNGRIRYDQVPLVAPDIEQMHDLFFRFRTGSVEPLPH